MQRRWKCQKPKWNSGRILSNLLNYVQHSKFNSVNHSLSIKPVNRYKTKSNEEREFREVDFSTVPQSLQGEYLDVYDGIQSDIVSSSRFDENSDISMTYLGRTGHKESQDKLKAEESFLISENDHVDCWIVQSVSCY